MNQMPFEVRPITAEETYNLRFNILRPHQPIEACHYPDDFKKESFHLGVFSEKEIISIASFFKENHPDVEGATQYRLRGMATIEAYRGQHAGSMLIEAGEAILKEKKVDTWWCNARVSAAEYYIKLGMIQVGAIYEIKPIGMHKRMFKKLRPVA